MEYKMVIAVRRDIKITPGKTAAQAAHAAVSCALAAKKKVPSIFEKWYSDGQRKIVVRVDTLRDLYELKACAESMGVVACTVTDAGLTEVPPGTVTCIGLGPGPSDTIDKLTGGLRLF